MQRTVSGEIETLPVEKRAFCEQKRTEDGQ